MVTAKPAEVAEPEVAVPLAMYMLTFLRAVFMYRRGPLTLWWSINPKKSLNLKSLYPRTLYLEVRSGTQRFGKRIPNLYPVFL